MKIQRAVLGMALFCLSAVCLAQTPKSYEEGSVVVVSSIRVKPGQWDNYMDYLAGPYHKVLSAQKEAGLILDHGVYAAYPRSPSEPNLYLTVVYANMAAFDGLDDKSEQVATKALSQSRQEGEKKYAERSEMREVLGSEMIRQLKLRPAK